SPQPVDASTVSGTPAYMAPEQFLAQPTGPATDQYALATIAYEMLCGKRPYADDSTTGSVPARLTTLYTPINTHTPELGSLVEVPLQRALAHDPKARYGKVSDFAAELGDALLPDRQRKRAVIVSDPVQAAQLRSARQTITGFLWGMAAVMVVVMLFSVAL